MAARNDPNSVKVTFQQPPLSPGSVWRRWDLHVHSPSSSLNNQFPAKGDGSKDWEAYVEALENLKDISAIGITDYFSVDGYKELLQHRRAGRLKNLSLVLPNIELRLNNVVYTSQAENKPKRLNAHVIFSEVVDPQTIEEHFLNQLKFEYRGVAQGQNELWNASRQQIEALGRRIKQEHDTFKGSDFAVGCTVITVDINDVKDVLENRGSLFRDRYLLILAEEGLSLIRWEGQDHQVKKVLLQGCDCLFSSNSDTRNWALGLKDLSPEQFRSEFGSLKPCVHGSDAHSLETIGRPDKNRYCWIKADTTFEGLKQILYEPAERVFIGEQPPNPKNDYQVIESITVAGAADWFGSRPIPLNPDLVAVIGGRGSGKSALAELIAFAGGAETFRESKSISDSFVFKASKKSLTNPFPITGGNITLRWRSGEDAPAELRDNLRHNLQVEKVKYLPQKFVETICAPENTDQLEAEVERVIFQRIPKVERRGASDLRELRNLRSGAVQVKKKQLRSSIEKLNRSIFETFNEVNLKFSKEASLRRSQSDLKELAQKPPQMLHVDPKDRSEVDRLTLLKHTLEASIAGFNEQLSILETIDARMTTFANEIQSFNEETSKLLSSVQLEHFEDAFMVAPPPQYQAVLKQRTEELSSRVLALTGGEGETLNWANAEIAMLTERFQISDAKRLEYDAFQRDKQLLEDSIAALQKDLNNIASNIEPALNEDRRKRLELYLDYFDLLKEEKASVERLYEPLHSALQSGTETDKKLEFASKIIFDVAAHAKRAFDLIDSRRRTRYKDVETLEQALRSLISRLENTDYDRDIARTEIQKFRESFLTDTDGKSITIGDQLRKDKTEEHFNNWFYDVEPFAVKYSMRFDNKDLSLLSPGQKGILLLLVYLEVDQDDRRPLIIDQPEDNLDNLSIYSNLVQYFRKRKKTRQMIIITHNPNLVVNTDSEQVIAAEYDGGRQPRIVYNSGSLENTSGNPARPGIREKVCSVLEGGSEAFRKREQKYSLPTATI